MKPFFIDNPDHPAIATTVDLIRTMRALDVNHDDPTIRKLARAVWPYDDLTDEVFHEVIIDGGMDEEIGSFEATARAKFNKGVVTVEHYGFMDFTFSGPWFEVNVIQRDYGDDNIGVAVHPVMSRDEKYVSHTIGIQIVQGKDGKRYVDWAKRTGTLLKLFGGA